MMSEWSQNYIKYWNKILSKWRFCNVKLPRILENSGSFKIWVPKCFTNLVWAETVYSGKFWFSSQHIMPLKYEIMEIFYTKLLVSSKHYFTLNREIQEILHTNITSLMNLNCLWLIFLLILFECLFLGHWKVMRRETMSSDATVIPLEQCRRHESKTSEFSCLILMMIECLFNNYHNEKY